MGEVFRKPRWSTGRVALLTLLGAVFASRGLAQDPPLQAVLYLEDGRLASGARIALADDEPLPSGLGVDQVQPLGVGELVVGEGGVLYLSVGTAALNVTLTALPGEEPSIVQAPFDDCVAGTVNRRCQSPGNRPRRAGAPMPRVRVVHPWLPDVFLPPRVLRHFDVSRLANDATLALLDGGGPARVYARNGSMRLMVGPSPSTVGAWWYVSGGALLTANDDELLLWRLTGGQPVLVSGIRRGERVRRVCEDGRQATYVILETGSVSRVARLESGHLREVGLLRTAPRLITCVRGGGVVALFADSDELVYLDGRRRAQYQLSHPNHGTTTSVQADGWLWSAGPGFLMSVRVDRLYAPTAWSASATGERL